MTTVACTVSQKSWTKIFIIYNMERKKIGQIQGRISRRRQVRNPTIQYIISTCIKYDFSSLHSFKEIFDKKFHYSKYGKKKNGQIQGIISMKRLVRNPTIQYIIINLHTKYNYSSFHSFTETFDKKKIIIQSMVRNKIGQIQRRISRRRLVCCPTIQHVIINLYTKYDYSSLQGCGEIFDKKVLWKEGMMARCKPVYLHLLFQRGGIIKIGPIRPEITVYFLIRSEIIFI